MLYPTLFCFFSVKATPKCIILHVGYSKSYNKPYSKPFFFPMCSFWCFSGFMFVRKQVSECHKSSNLKELSVRQCRFHCSFFNDLLSFQSRLIWNFILKAEKEQQSQDRLSLFNQHLSLFPRQQHAPVDVSDPACGEWGEQGHHVVLCCVTHIPHAHAHIYVHTDPITHHHLHKCPMWPFILSWAVAEPPYTSAGFWLTGREDTPTWSPFSSSTTPPSPQTPPPRPPLRVPGENTLEPKCFRAGCFLGRKGFVSGQCALLWWRVLFHEGVGERGKRCVGGGGGQLTMRGKRRRGGAVRIRDKTCGCLKKQTAAQAGWQKFVCVWKGPEVEVGWLCDEVVGVWRGGYRVWRGEVVARGAEGV